jgi:hypothetical protein
MQVFKVHHPGSQYLNDTMTQIQGLSVSFNVAVSSHVFILGHVGFQHLKISIPSIGDNYAIGIGARLRHSFQGNSGIWVEGSKWGANIVNGRDHYLIIPLSGYLLVGPGTHEISFWARAMTDAAGAPPEPAEVKGNSSGLPNDPYNQMIVRIEPA